jgi:dynactin-6
VCFQNKIEIISKDFNPHLSPTPKHNAPPFYATQMNEPSSPKDLIKFVRHEIQERGDRSSYMTIKQKCLELFTTTYFEKNKELVSGLLESRDILQNPTTDLSDTQFSPGCMVCENAIVRGRVVIGPGTVVQPCTKIIATGLGTIIIGADNIFEEQCLIVNDTDDDMVIGTMNLFEVGCEVRASSVGNRNRFGVRSTLGWGSVLNDDGLVVALQEVAEETTLENHFLMTPMENRAVDRSDSVTLHRQHMLDYLTALRSPSSRTSLLNFHKIHPMQKE